MKRESELTVRSVAASPGRRVVRAAVASQRPVAVYDRRSGSIVDEVLLLAGVRLPTQAPLLTDHRNEIPAQVGSVSGFRVSGDELEADLSFATDHPGADAAWALVSQRHCRSVSVGYQVADYVDIAPGQTRVVAGKSYTASANRVLRITTSWELREVSLTPVGADSSALIRSAFTPAIFSKGLTMSSSIVSSVGPCAGSMKLCEFGAALLRGRNASVPEADADIFRAAFSGVDGAAALEGIVNASILAGFRQALDSTAGWVRTIPLPNYLAAQLAVVDQPPRLENVGRGDTASVVNISLSTSGTWRLARFGAQFCLDEQDSVDGETIGVMQTALEQIGAAARRIMPDLVYSLLLTNAALGDGVALFHADRGNLGSGAGSAFGETGLDSGIEAVTSQIPTDEEGDPVHQNYSPRYLIVPPAKYGSARRCVSNMQTGDGQDLVVRTESRLTTTGVVDPRSDEVVAANGTSWLLACPADQAAGVVVGLLNGKAEPTIRRYELSEGAWGYGFDVSFSVGVTAADPRALYFALGV